jgi:hypothetical protein
MSLPSSGALSFSVIANDLPLYAPYGGPYGSLDKMTMITGVGGSWDGSNNFNRNAPYNTSAFYSWGGGGFKFGNYEIIHDYALNGHYASPSSVITDSSGNTRNGVFVTGTGNGTAVNVTGYNSGIGYIGTQTANQYAVRLNNYAKFPGTSNHTLITWVNVSVMTSSFPGIIACEGRSGGQPIGYSLYLNKINELNFGVNYTRWLGSTGTAFNVNVTPLSQPLLVGFWYMIVATFDGSTILVQAHRADNNALEQASGSNSYSIISDTSWGCFQGLRYNNWLDGYFGYTAIYNYALNPADIVKIQRATRLRYI